MTEIVPVGTKAYKTPEKIRIKKKQQLEFRRWIIGKSSGLSLSIAS